MILLQSLQGVLSWLGWYVLPFLAILSVIVFIHELGHYSAGRFFNLKIIAFSLGFGPELLAYVDKRGTRWRLAAFPIGGYVNFDADGAVASTGDHDAIQVMTDEQRARTLVGAKLYQRAIVVAAGPVANFILALVIFTGMYMVQGRVVHLPRVGEVVAGSAAEKAGFQPGDLVLSMNGEAIESFEALHQVVSVNTGLPIDVRVRRGEAVVPLTATPTLTLVNMGVLGKHRMAQLGVVASNAEADRAQEQCGPLTCVAWGAQNIGEIVHGTYAYVVGIFAGREAVDQVTGPIGVSHIAGEIAKVSPIELFTLGGFFSVSVGLMNLLPIPLLDGGHLMFYLVEAIVRRPLNKRFQELALKVGVAIIAFLVLFTTSHDIFQLLGLAN